MKRNQGAKSVARTGAGKPARAAPRVAALGARAIAASAVAASLAACTPAHRTIASAPVAAGTDWKLVKRPDLGISYWQARIPGSVELMEKDPEGRQREIDRRVGEVDAREANGQGCPAGMVRVQGQMKDWEGVLAVQHQSSACLKADNPRWDPKDKCYLFDAAKMRLESVPAFDMSFCIDRFEFPNIPNEAPAVMTSWMDARKACEAQGKRLCEEDEWTFACEGERALPYPYGDGVTRDASVCNVDAENKNAPMPRHNMKIGTASELAAAARELDQLWRGVPSGSRPGCRSPFGVYDMTGNVDEWALHSRGRPWETRKPGSRPLTGSTDPHKIHSIMKGGWWGPIRGRCQPATTSHDENFQNYESGFRCCANAR